MSEQRADDDKICRRCKCAVHLIDGREWPEDDDLIYCSSCSIDVIRDLRLLVVRLKNNIRKLRVRYGD